MVPVPTYRYLRTRSFPVLHSTNKTYKFGRRKFQAETDSFNEQGCHKNQERVTTDNEEEDEDPLGTIEGAKCRLWHRRLRKLAFTTVEDHFCLLEILHFSNLASRELPLELCGAEATSFPVAAGQPTARTP